MTTQKIVKRKKCNTSPKQRCSKETLISCLPQDFNTFLFGIVTIVYLIVGMIVFYRTGDYSMLNTLFAGVVYYSCSAAKGKTSPSKGKREKAS